jgi:hypothetical protein
VNDDSDGVVCQRAHIDSIRRVHRGCVNRSQRALAPFLRVAEG